MDLPQECNNQTCTTLITERIGNLGHNRGICPEGWHIPASWNTLRDYAGGVTVEGNKLKAKSGWENNPKYPNGTDNYGFSALPGGYVNESGRSWSLGVTVRFWSSNEHPSWATQPPEKIAVARNVAIMGDDLRFNPNSGGITYDGGGHSVKHEPNYVRCIQDE
jgi:uncharacterized protein (TIGR02145 family)